jgi:O-antigen/teichoic acid export membrane protein
MSPAPPDVEDVGFGADPPAPAAPALPPEADVASTHRAERSKRLTLSIVSSLLSKPLALIVPLVTVPLFLRYLGKEGYGLYESIGALAAWVTLSNAGLGLGLMNRLTDTYVSGDRALARKYVSTMVIAMLAIAVVGGLLLALAVAAVDWPRHFPDAGPLRSQVPWAIFAAGALTLLGLVLPVNPIYTAHQEIHRSNVWDAASRIIGLGACFAVTWTHWGLVGVVLAASGVPLLVRLANTADLFLREKPWLLPTPRLFDASVLRSMLGQGVVFLVLQAGVVAIYESDKLVILKLLGPDAVTRYAIPGRLFVMMYGVFMLMISPLWPAHGEALRRGDVAWTRRALRWSLVLGCGSILLFGTVMFFFGPQIVRIWTGKPVDFSRTLIAGLTLMFALRAWVDCRSIIVNSAGVLIPQLAFYGGHAVLNVIVAFLLAPRFGIEGVAWATVLTALVTSTWGYPWMVRKYIFGKQQSAPHAGS